MRALPVIALVIAAACTSPRAPTAGSAPGALVVVVAHQDDDLLFMSPDLLARIRAGGVVRTIDVTAGDAGLESWDDGYLSLAPAGVRRYHWQLREDGIRAAYAAMARVADAWTTTEVVLGTKRVALATLRDAPNVSLVFFRLPDGNMDGKGFEPTCRASVARLWTGEIPEVHPVDAEPGCQDARAGAGWTRDDVVRALGAAMRTPALDEVWTLDATGGIRPDHSDHTTVARFVEEARRQYAPAAPLRMYRGYEIAAEPVNLSPSEHAAKQQVFMTYAAYDMCKYPRPGPDGRADAERCERSIGWDYAKWEWRQYRVAPVAYSAAAADAGGAPSTSAHFRRP